MQEDPFPTYHHFLEHEPWSYNPKMDFYALFRFEDVWDATLDWKTYSSSLGPSLENRGQVPGELFSIIGLDPPRHTRLRNIVSRGFTPKRIAALEPEVRKLAARYLDALRDETRFDVQQAFSVKLPMDVISVLLGIPEADRDWYRHTVDKGLERDPETGQPGMENLFMLGKSRALVLELLAERRKSPQEDLITVIAESEYSEPDGTRPPPQRRRGRGLLHAARGGRRRDDCQADRQHDRVPLPASGSAQIRVRGCGRAAAPLRSKRCCATTRRASSRARGDARREHARRRHSEGRARRPGDRRRLPRPARVRRARPARRHAPRQDRELYFGYGQHVCIGKSLARIETRVAMQELHARWPDWHVDESGLTRTYQAHVRGFQNVPLVR